MTDEVLGIFKTISEEVVPQADTLRELDAKIGDGDLGITVTRGAITSPGTASDSTKSADASCFFIFSLLFGWMRQAMPRGSRRAIPGDSRSPATYVCQDDGYIMRRWVGRVGGPRWPLP